MKTQIETYQREIEIHKEVEKELAKRSHFCQKVIKRLKQDINDIQSGKQEEGATGSGAKASAKLAMPERDDRGNEDLINFLEQKLDQHEKNLIAKQQDYDILQTEYSELQEKVSLQRHKYKRAALLLTEFLEDILNSTPNILSADKDLHLNLDRIKETPVEDLPKEDKVTLVLVLLKQL